MAVNIETIRHSLAHILAAAVKKLYPGVKFGIGPEIKSLTKINNGCIIKAAV